MKVKSILHLFTHVFHFQFAMRHVPFYLHFSEFPTTVRAENSIVLLFNLQQWLFIFRRCSLLLHPSSSCRLMLSTSIRMLRLRLATTGCLSSITTSRLWSIRLLWYIRLSCSSHCCTKLMRLSFPFWYWSLI